MNVCCPDGTVTYLGLNEFTPPNENQDRARLQVRKKKTRKQWLSMTLRSQCCNLVNRGQLNLEDVATILDRVLVAVLVGSLDRQSQIRQGGKDREHPMHCLTSVNYAAANESADGKQELKKTIASIPGYMKRSCGAQEKSFEDRDLVLRDIRMILRRHSSDRRMLAFLRPRSAVISKAGGFQRIWFSNASISGKIGPSTRSRDP